ncbi:hypothetical protein E2C01_024441 [Portunus trituberculatus]|uniref:Uncharacterized protein n=1 Tax=Portunus trituberculatus TaxID=210409 RepID=A0A5B7EAK6_PORTR|nr:hypothetical protein [Portunus trituberculatus]
MKKNKLQSVSTFKEIVLISRNFGVDKDAFKEMVAYVSASGFGSFMHGICEDAKMSRGPATGKKKKKKKF